MSPHRSGRRDPPRPTGRRRGVRAAHQVEWHLSRACATHMPLGEFGEGHAREVALGAVTGQGGIAPRLLRLRALFHLPHLRPSRVLRELRVPPLRHGARLRPGRARRGRLDGRARCDRGDRRLQLAQRPPRPAVRLRAHADAARGRRRERARSSWPRPRRPSGGCCSSSRSWGSRSAASFASTCSPGRLRPVTMGHADGLVTLDLAEFGDAHREAMREQMGEPYRTVLGHLRHEVGHHYWTVLASRGRPRERARRCSATSARTTWPRWSATTPSGPPPTGPSATSAPARHAPRRGLGGDLRALPAHPRHAADRGRLPRHDRHRPPDPAHAEPGSMDASIADWLPMSLALNQLNRSMGNDDLTRSCSRPR